MSRSFEFAVDCFSLKDTARCNELLDFKLVAGLQIRHRATKCKVRESEPQAPNANDELLSR